MSFIIMISIHATHTGGDTAHAPLARGTPDFNPRHPYGWRHFWQYSHKNRAVISIHATHTGGDNTIFYVMVTETISIHATHTGGDIYNFFICHDGKNFNPRHPYGWRHLHFYSILTVIIVFQSTPPIRVATNRLRCHGPVRNFNPRHPYGWRQSLFYSRKN